MLMNNEYGLAKGKYLSGFNMFSKAMVNVEFCMEMYIGGYDMGVFWDNDAGTLTDESKLMVPGQDYRFTPTHWGIQWMAQSAGQTYIPLTTSNPRVRGYAATDGNGNHLIYLINKMEEDQTAAIAFPSDATGDIQVNSMVDTSEHWSKVETLDTGLQMADCGTDCVAVTLPSVSFTVIRRGADFESFGGLWE